MLLPLVRSSVVKKNKVGKLEINIIFILFYFHFKMITLQIQLLEFSCFISCIHESSTLVFALDVFYNVRPI
jgi:hypothetical protein